jgi:hypothetical protein
MIRSLAPAYQGAAVKIIAKFGLADLHELRAAPEQHLSST